MTLHTLSSGSQGNCLLLSDGGTHILVDAGISTRRIKTGLARLGLSMDDLDGILITHEHTDHISGLATLIKHHTVPLYASPGTARQLAYRLAGVEPLLRQSQRLLSQVIVQVEGDHLKIATLIIHLQIHMMIIATMLMMSMTMITVIHMTQENIPMNARRHENMMYRDTIVSRTVSLYK